MLKAKFITDTVPPTIGGGSVSASAFSPNGDGTLDTTTARVTATGLVRWGYIVQAIQGTTLGPKLRTGTGRQQDASLHLERQGLHARGRRTGALPHHLVG
jgi:hypothetical protein